MASYGSSTGAKTFIDADILTRDVTVDENDHTVDGEGLFDQLMSTATKHLEQQFEANRIRAEDYATAYIELYKATLTAALQAWDTQLKDENTEAQIELLQCQAKQACAQASLIETQIEQEKYKTEYLLPAQVAEIEAQTAKENAQTEQIEYQTANTLPAQKEYTEAQTTQLTYQTEHVLPAQVAYSEQQTKTSKAQEAVYYRQVEGFDENYKEKILKICLDAWGVGFSVAEDALYSSTDASKAIPSAMTTSTLNTLWNNYIFKDLNTAATGTKGSSTAYTNTTDSAS